MRALKFMKKSSSHYFLKIIFSFSCVPKKNITKKKDKEMKRIHEREERKSGSQKHLNILRMFILHMILICWIFSPSLLFLFVFKLTKKIIFHSTNDSDGGTIWSQTTNYPWRLMILFSQKKYNKFVGGVKWKMRSLIYFFFRWEFFLIRCHFYQIEARVSEWSEMTIKTDKAIAQPRTTHDIIKMFFSRQKTEREKSLTSEKMGIFRAFSRKRIFVDASK